MVFAVRDRQSDRCWWRDGLCIAFVSESFSKVADNDTRQTKRRHRWFEGTVGTLLRLCLENDFFFERGGRLSFQKLSNQAG